MTMSVRGWLWRRRLAATGALGHLAAARAALALAPDEVARLQRSRLADLLLHAHAHVPYYRRALEDAGVVVADAGGAREVRLERFPELPPLGKADLRERFDDLTSDDAASRGAYATSTGGSTGEPPAFR